MSATAHALLSPSSSSRWLNCTPSARLEEKVEDKGSEYAEQGTCAHALCECKLRHLLNEETLESINEFKLLRDKWYDTEMENCANDYVEIVWNKYQEALKSDRRARLLVEQQLNFSSWIPNSFGTADAEIVTENTMEVIDFKYGKGVEVSAVKNTQMMIYALGALGDYDLDYDIKEVHMTIVQPRLHNVSEWTISADELKAWADTTLRERANMAFAGEGEQKAGEWCKFCKVKARCAVLANNAVAAYTQHTDKTLITDEEMPSILGLIPAIKSWCTAVEDYATAMAIDGHKWKGFKLVEGRSVRKVTDPDGLSSRLEYAGYSDIYKPAELKSIGDLERMIGRKTFFELSDGFIDKPVGKPTLVSEDDKRPEINVNSAIEDFKDLII